MKVFLDTNILFSAMLFPHSTPDKALQKALLGPYQVVTCDYVFEEMRECMKKKFPSKTAALEVFLSRLAMNVEVVRAPFEADGGMLRLRDPKDQPILRAAIASHCDVLISGDKDFLEANLERPKAITAADFYINY